MISIREVENEKYCYWFLLCNLKSSVCSCLFVSVSSEQSRKSRHKLRSVFAWVLDHICWLGPRYSIPVMSAEMKKNISKHCFTWESDPSSSRTFSLIYSWPALSMTLAHILTSGSSLWNSSGPRVTPQLHFSPSSPPSLSPLHVSRFGRDTGLHILCSSVSARPAERGEDIWLWWSYSVYKQIIASNTSD